MGAISATMSGVTDFQKSAFGENEAEEGSIEIAFRNRKADRRPLKHFAPPVLTWESET
jgi:hypothetical protein